jgi:glycosyltransferase involved in cell wall biosynthesis
LRSDYLFSNAESVKQSLAEVYSLPSEVVPTGADTTFFTPPEVRPDNRRVRVLFAGSVREYKEPQTVVQAAARFPEADFVIVGEGVLRPELERLVKNQRLENVRFTGPLSQDEIRAEFRAADIFFYPSHWEGSPKVVVEAAACGLPVIVRKDYQPETVIDSETGYIVSSDEELFARLGELIQNAQSRRLLGNAGREYIKKFDWEPISQRWAEIFILAAQRASGKPSRSAAR